MLLPIILAAGFAVLVALYFLFEFQKIKDGNVSAPDLKELIALSNGEDLSGDKAAAFDDLTKKYALSPIVNATVESVGNKIIGSMGGENRFFETTERATVYHDKISTSVIEYEGERDDRYFTVYGGEVLPSLKDKFAVARAIGVGLKDFLKDSFFEIFATKDIAIEIKVTSCVVTRTKIKERVARINVKVVK